MIEELAISAGFKDIFEVGMSISLNIEGCKTGLGVFVDETNKRKMLLLEMHCNVINVYI